MDDNTAETRKGTIVALNAALEELESGEGLSRFVDLRNLAIVERL